MARKVTKRMLTTEPLHSDWLPGLKELEEKIGHKYRDSSFLRNALTHGSYANESGIEGLDDNERLEFVGDAVLQFVVSDYLYRNHPEKSEGELTVMRSSIVGRKHCAGMAKELGLDDYVLVGKGERDSARGVKKSILANAFEALIASLYLDGGIRAARRFILRMIQEHMSDGVGGDENFKARLQAICQRTAGVLPSYRLISAKGPDHEKTFEVEVSINGVPSGRGKGATKKEAQQQAARKALQKVAKDSPE